MPSGHVSLPCDSGWTGLGCRGGDLGGEFTQPRNGMARIRIHKL